MPCTIGPILRRTWKRSVRDPIDRSAIQSLKNGESAALVDRSNTLIDRNKKPSGTSSNLRGSDLRKIVVATRSAWARMSIRLNRICSPLPHPDIARTRHSPLPAGSRSVRPQRREQVALGVTRTLVARRPRYRDTLSPSRVTMPSLSVPGKDRMARAGFLASPERDLAAGSILAADRSNGRFLIAVGDPAPVAVAVDRNTRGAVAGLQRRQNIRRRGTSVDHGSLSSAIALVGGRAGSTSSRR